MSVPAPRWAHDRVLFDIEVLGTRVPCAVSKAAIQDAGQLRSNLPSEVMAAFGRLRPRIEGAALAKLHARPEGPDGVLHIWSEDLEDAAEAVSPEQA